MRKWIHVANEDMKASKLTTCLHHSTSKMRNQLITQDCALSIIPILNIIIYHYIRSTISNIKPANTTEDTNSSKYLLSSPVIKLLTIQCITRYPVSPVS